LNLRKQKPLDIKMNQIQNFALQIETQLGFEETIEIVTELLTAEGFGILTEIDVKATFRKKLDIDWEPHRILGACNPEFARKTLSAVPEIAVLLPCNFVVRDKGDHRQVQAMEPRIMSEIVDNERVAEVAAEVSQRIRRVLDKLEAI